MWFPAALTRASLSWNHIGTAGARPLSDCLRVNNALQTLKYARHRLSLTHSLANNTLCAAGARLLADSLIVNRCLTTLR